MIWYAKKFPSQPQPKGIWCEYSPLRPPRRPSAPRRSKSVAASDPRNADQRDVLVIFRQPKCWMMLDIAGSNQGKWMKMLTLPAKSCKHLIWRIKIWWIAPIYGQFMDIARNGDFTSKVSDFTQCMVILNGKNIYTNGGKWWHCQQKCGFDQQNKNL